MDCQDWAQDVASLKETCSDVALGRPGSAHERDAAVAGP